MKFGWKKFLPVLWLAGNLSTVSAQTAAPVISLTQAVQMSLAAGYDQQVNQATWDAARASHAQDLAKGNVAVTGTGSYSLARTTYDPASVGTSNYNDGLPQTVQAGATAGFQNTTVAVSGSMMFENLANSKIGQTASLGLTLSQIVWDGYLGGLPSATLAKSDLTWQNSTLTASLTKLNNIYNLKQAYYTMLSAQEGMEVLQNTLKKQQLTLQNLQAKFDAQLASAIDLKTAKVNARSAEIDVKNGINTLRAARVRLALLLGKPSDYEFTVAAEADPPISAASVDEAVKVGLTQRVELRQLDLSQKNSKIDTDVAQTLGQPTVTVTAGFTRNVVNQDQENLLSAGKLNQGYTQDALNLGVKVSLPVWDSGYSAAKTEQNRQLAGLYGLQLEQKRRSVAADIVDAYNTYLIRKDKMDLAVQNVEVLGGQYEVTKAQQEAGTAKITDVLTAEVNFETAQYALVQARINLQLAALALDYALGNEETLR